MPAETTAGAAGAAWASWTAWVAFGIYLGGLLVVFGLRTWLHYRATGDTGHRHSRPKTGSAPWWAQVLMAAAVVLGLTAPLLTATGVLSPPSWLDGPAVAVAGLVVALVAFAALLAAQSAMGRSWRVGVDPSERTELVTGGVFGLVRNPVFTAMMIATVGQTLAVPVWPQALGLLALVIGIHLQVRVIEEPYLAQVHGDTYRGYAARVGRFLPRLRRQGQAAGAGDHEAAAAG